MTVARACMGPHQRLVYSVDGAAEQLSISKTVLYELIAAGDIEVIHYAEGRRRVGITHQALVTFIGSREAEEVAANPRTRSARALAATG